MPNPPSNGLGRGPVGVGILGLEVGGGLNPIVVEDLSSSEGPTTLGRAVSVSSTAAAVEAKLGLAKDEDSEA